MKKVTVATMREQTWLLDEPDKVAHRDYSTGFYYPEHKVQQSLHLGASPIIPPYQVYH